MLLILEFPKHCRSSCVIEAILLLICPVCVYMCPVSLDMEVGNVFLRTRPVGAYIKGPLLQQVSNYCLVMNDLSDWKAVWCSGEIASFGS